MKIDRSILQALEEAVSACGGAKEFAAKCGISASNISRYLSGKVRSITDDCWDKLKNELPLYPVRTAPGTIRNTPELRAFLQNAMEKNGISGAEQLRRAIGYDSVQTIKRLLNGELNWFPDVLSAVLDALDCDRNKLPLNTAEFDLLAPSGIYRDGAMLVRPVPVVDWANAASDLASVESDETVMCRWDVENTLTVPVPVGSRSDMRAFKVHGISMEPRILDDDIVLVEPVTSIDDIPENKIVIVRFNDDSTQPDLVVCKRFHRQPGSRMLLTSDNPEGKIISAASDEVCWMGIVVKKISEM